MCYTNLQLSGCFGEDLLEGKKHDTMGIFFMNMHLQTNTQFYRAPCYIVCFPLITAKIVKCIYAKETHFFLLTRKRFW